MVGVPETDEQTANIGKVGGPISFPTFGSVSKRTSRLRALPVCSRLKFPEIEMEATSSLRFEPFASLC